MKFNPLSLSLYLRCLQLCKLLTCTKGSFLSLPPSFLCLWEKVFLTHQILSFVFSPLPLLLPGLKKREKSCFFPMLLHPHTHTPVFSPPFRLKGGGTSFNEASCSSSSWLGSPSPLFRLLASRRPLLLLLFLLLLLLFPRGDKTLPPRDSPCCQQDRQEETLAGEVGEAPLFYACCSMFPLIQMTSSVSPLLSPSPPVTACCRPQPPPTKRNGYSCGVLQYLAHTIRLLGRLPHRIKLALALLFNGFRCLI